nr:fumarylacetoacetate hydrolase family protein [Halomonas socia]
MKLGRIETAHGDMLVARAGERVIDLRKAVEMFLQATGAVDARSQAASYVPADMNAFLARGGADDDVVRHALDETGASHSTAIEAVSLLAPLDAPGKILGVGRNYGEHAAEGGLARQGCPRLFLKATSSVVGPGAAIIRPTGVTKLDWEHELAVVIGRPMKAVPQAEALDHVAGYTILNDVSAREFQFDVSPPQTSFAKSMDSFTPIGPWLVTRDEIPDPGALKLRCWVNDQLMQEGSVADMIFPVPYLLSYISQYMTLDPGDVIATGTPAGVGHFRDPPRYLTPGDQLRMEITKLGVLENSVV